MIALVLFSSALAITIYTFLVFPLLLAVRAWLFPKPYAEQDVLPTVSMLIACHNEEANIERKLHNVLALDYPAAAVIGAIVLARKD